MGKMCVAFGCSNRNKDGVSLHNFPNPTTEKKRLDEWIRQVKRTRLDWTCPPLPYLSPAWRSCVVCSEHFTQDSFEYINSVAASMGYKTKATLKPDAVPTVFRRKEPSKASTVPARTDSVTRKLRHHRMINSLLSPAMGPVAPTTSAGSSNEDDDSVTPSLPSAKDQSTQATLRNKSTYRSKGRKQGNRETNVAGLTRETKPSTAPTAQESTDDNLYKCQFCGKKFKAASDLKRHIRTHTGERPYRCEACDEGFAQLGNLKRHLQACHNPVPPPAKNKTYNCQYCSKVCPSTFNLKRHIRSHTGERPFKCDHCGKAFMQLVTLQQHLPACPKPRDNSQDCGKELKTESELTQHICRTQPRAKRKSRTCLICGKTFVSPYKLQLHSRIHSGEPLYRCEPCDKAFTQAGTLKRHREVCPNAFTSADRDSGDVFAVEVEVDTETSCEVCSETFNTKDQYYEHLKSHNIDLIVI